MSSDTFKWQDRGTAWKGIGIYHVTLTIPNREPLLGELIIPDNDPSKAEVKRTQLGEDLVDCLMHLYEHYPEVRILQFCLMPDHLHAIWYVRQAMPSGIMGRLLRNWGALILRLFPRILFGIRNEVRFSSPKCHSSARLFMKGSSGL